MQGFTSTVILGITAGGLLQDEGPFSTAPSKTGYIVFCASLASLVVLLGIATGYPCCSSKFFGWRLALEFLACINYFAGTIIGCVERGVATCVASPSSFIETSADMVVNGWVDSSGDWPAGSEGGFVKRCRMVKAVAGFSCIALGCIITITALDFSELSCCCPWASDDFEAYYPRAAYSNTRNPSPSTEDIDVVPRLQRPARRMDVTATDGTGTAFARDGFVIAESSGGGRAIAVSGDPEIMGPELIVRGRKSNDHMLTDLGNYIRTQSTARRPLEDRWETETETESD